MTGGETQTAGRKSEAGTRSTRYTSVSGRQSRVALHQTGWMQG
ncbi:hypothetical protein [Halovenus amylolytica]